MTRIVSSLLLLLAIFLPASAVQVTVVWPAGAVGDYSIAGFGPKSTADKTSYEIPEGANTRLVGDGFALNFTVKNGKVFFPYSTGSALDSQGVHFDEATNTFTFETVDIHVVKKNYEGEVGIDSQPASAAPADGTYKVVYGAHTLSCPDKLDFRVDSHGIILLLNSVAGVTARGSTITVEGLPVEVIPVGGASWTISPGQPATGKTGKATVYLVPTERGYNFQSTAKGTFFLSNDGRVSLQKDGTYHEFVSLPDGTTIGMPDGQAKYASRIKQEEADIDLHEKVLAASAAAPWKLDFNLVERMKLIDFPEEQLSYPITLPAGIDPKDLKLLEFTDKSVRVVPFQLLWIKGASSPSTIYFRSDLPLGGSRLFRLVQKFDVKGIPYAARKEPALQTSPGEPDTAILANGLLSVKVPAGHHDFTPAKPLAQVSAPILGLARGAAASDWVVAGSFVVPDAQIVSLMDAAIKESGPLFLTYEVTYHLANKKDYTVDLEQRAGDAELQVSETLAGFKPEDQAYLRLDYGKLDPDRRLVPSNGGYDLYGGAYDRNASTDGSKAMWPVTVRWLDYDPKLDSSMVPQLNFSLGLFMPNNLGVTRTVCFYNETGKDALLVSAMRLRDWQTATREVWNSFRGPENFRFYADGPKKYLQAGLSGTARFWAVSLIPRDDVVLRSRPGLHLGAGPEVWLNSKLNFWSLDAYKDRAVEWDEKLDAAPFDKVADAQTGKPYVAMTFDDYVTAHLHRSLMWIINFQDDFGGGLWTRDAPSAFGDYARSRAAWTPEQRDQIRQILVALADYCEGDDRQPQHSMLSGHPNFVMDTKAVVPIAAATFPGHPRAKAWRDSFMSFFTEFMDKYDRKDVPELNTVGGRWTENIACYVGQDMVGFRNDEDALKAYDGTSLGKNAQMLSLVRWMRDAMMSPHDGVRMFPPQGAHAQACEPGSLFWNNFFALAQDFAADDPKLAPEMQWMQTNGAQGTKPDIHSALYTDYGPVFHYDFVGAHESYAHLQNINGMSYRWGYDGIVYYGAKNKVWSYNGRESNGDEFDWAQVTALTVDGQGLAVGPTDQLLYDFDFAQFYRQPGKSGDDYGARALMLVRDDYLVISDEMKSADVAAIFRWVNRYDMPQIYQLKPGATMAESTYTDEVHGKSTEPPANFTVRSYSGKGDFLTVVAPAAVTAAATPFGATVNSEFVFASQKPEDITQGDAVFSGSYGYARPNQLALFVGTKIGLGGFTLQRSGGDFGVSAAVDGKTIAGRIVGRKGGKISIVPPTGMDPAKASVTLAGKPAPHTMEQGAVVFSVDIAQKDGLKNYVITF